ncbi:hypothetical protein [Flavobacterium sp.]|uniref:hypothetical protein n=1 Tax=Flavobacterium sp. TaxID=239 RepID=UPI002601EAAA|nr:hypothetical protein [Flavobacterium sp.]MDD3004442.1 hypothetical protein [Flavobacterium sp.]
MKYISIIFVFIFIVSCSSDETKNAVLIATSIDVSITNEAGQDLLNSQNENSYNPQDIKIYYIDNFNAEILFDRPLWDYSKGFFIYERPNDKFAIRIFTNDIIESEIRTTLIKWNNTETDTIKCEIEREGNYYTAVTKVWYNGILKYDGDGETYFEIVK